MSRPSWLDNSAATVFGIIFFAPYVIFAYRINTYTLNGEPMSGGRLFWRDLGWTLLSAIPFFGLIYGLVKLSDIIETRIKVWEIMNYHNYQQAQQAPQQGYYPPG